MSEKMTGERRAERPRDAVEGDAVLGGAATVEVVAVVTSAGGLDALSRVLGELEPGFPTAVVVGQHLGGHGSRLVEILGRRVALPVEWARDGAPIKPGRITVCPPRTVLEVLPDRTCAVRPTLGVARERPLDALLTSVADGFGAGAVGVVLTGLGRDGAAGTTAITAAGGIVIAQSEQTAEHPAMPRAAAEAGADIVLPLHEIAGVVADFVSGQPLPRPSEEEDAIRATFGDEGEVARLAHRIDWGTTPLGPVREWSTLLRATVRLVMESPHPSILYWGNNHLSLPNDAAVPTIRERLENVMARPLTEGFPEAISEGVAPRYAQVLAGQATYLSPYRARFERNGRMADSWYDVSYTPVREADGSGAGVLVVFLERTQEVLASRRLATVNRLASIADMGSRREALERSLEILTEAEDVVFASAYLLDRDQVRAGLVGACGIEPGGAMAPEWSRLSPGDPWPFSEVVREGRVVEVRDLQTRFRGHVVGPDDETPEQAVLQPLREGVEGNVAGVMIVGVNPRLALDDGYRDFLSLVGETVAAKVAEAHSRQRERDRLERLAELDRAKTEFLSNISHEFRTPLTLMLGPLEDLLGDAEALPAHAREELELVRRNAYRLLRLVATMLDISQIEAGRLRAQFVATDLAGRTREIVAQFESAVARAGLELRLDLDDLPEPIWVDPEMWEKIVSNLLSNALKFTFEGGIEVTLRARPKHAELVVRDTGVGIPRDELGNIFQRFHRVPGTRARTNEGAGIGLALVDELVRRHHGRLRASSVPGQGTAFTVWMPFGEQPSRREAPTSEPRAALLIASEMADEATRWDTAGATDDANAKALEGLDEELPLESLGRYAPGARILVVDDNPDMRGYLSRLLSKPWRTEQARDGQEALALVRRDRPDLVLADIMMPSLDGIDLVAEIRADEQLRDLPVVLVTARAAEETAIEALLAGADDYIVKPFSARELLARVGGQLQLARMRQSAADLNAFRVELADALRAQDDPQAIEQIAARKLVEQLGAERGHFFQIDEQKGCFVAGNGYCVAGITPPPTSFPIDHAPLATAVRTARPFVVTDPPQVAVPLLMGESITEVLAVDQRSQRGWASDEVALIAEVAARVATELERARAQANLRQAHEQTTEILESIGDIFYAVDDRWRLIYVNRRAEAVWERNRNDLLGTVLWDMFPDYETTVGYREHARAMRERVPVHFETFSPNLKVWVEADVYPTPNGGVAVYFRDISDRKRGEVTSPDGERQPVSGGPPLPSGGVGTVVT
jgi:signal transduction histidine kinase/chemotaxis response regulator CheB